LEPSPVVPDSDLVALAVSGDQEARDLLVRRLTRRVRGIALAILGNPADAEDAAQAILLEILSSLRSYRGGHLVAWCDRIAARTAMRHARSRRVREAREDAEVDFEALAQPARPGSREQVPRSILEYLSELPETRRVALVLRHVLDYSIEEIAELTETSPNTVKDRLLRAREHVRKSVRRDLAVLPRAATRGGS
jgi:RNA polymerase sigma-70 factor (ECF subfamily)